MLKEREEQTPASTLSGYHGTLLEWAPASRAQPAQTATQLCPHAQRCPGLNRRFPAGARADCRERAPADAGIVADGGHHRNERFAGETAAQLPGPLRIDSASPLNGSSVCGSEISAVVGVHIVTSNIVTSNGCGCSNNAVSQACWN